MMVQMKILLFLLYSFQGTTWDQTTATCPTGHHNDGYTSLNAAIEACKMMISCVGVYDQCGNGEKFRTCTTSSQPSGCGTIFYKKSGNMTRPVI